MAVGTGKWMVRLVLAMLVVCGGVNANSRPTVASCFGPITPNNCVSPPVTPAAQQPHQNRRLIILRGGGHYVRKGLDVHFFE